MEQLNYRNVLLISEDYIKSNSTLDNNISGKYLQAAITSAQDVELQSTIGTKLLEALQKKCINWIDPHTPVHPIEPPEPLSSDSIDDSDNYRYKELLDYYVQPYLLYQVLSEIVIPISYKLGNFGVMRTDDEKDIAAEASQVNQIKKYYRDKADFFKTRLQDFIITYYNEFPELYTYKPLKDMFPNLYSSSSCNIWLGGARGKGWSVKPGEGPLQRAYDFPSSNNKKSK